MDEEKKTTGFSDQTPEAAAHAGGAHRWPSALSRPAESAGEEGDKSPEPLRSDPAGEDVLESILRQGAEETDAIRELEEGTPSGSADAAAPYTAESDDSAPPVPRRERRKTGRRKRKSGRKDHRDPEKKRGEEKKPPKKPTDPELEEENDPHEIERNYRPIRTRRDSRVGCLGGFMYAVFIISASILLAVFAWISAADVLALNKTAGTVEITIPEGAFYNKVVEVKDADGNVTGEKTVRAADLSVVAGVLKDHGLINYKWLFKQYSRFAHADTQIDPGTYVLTTNLDYRALVKKMQAGSGTQVQTLVMFPEGYNMDQIFAKLEKEGVCSAADLYEAAANAEFSYSFLEGAETGDAYRLEGFLFPDTYYFYQGMQAASAINKFLSNFHYRITDEMWQQTNALHLTFREMLTIASIIEKEAANDEERATIASVIYNRLAADMPLQVDATVLYALRDRSIIKLTTELIQNTDSPYNTYLYNGLPPGPICSPGMASIKAALVPQNTPYYYYALDTSTGTHRFFTNLAEHEAFVATQDYG